MALHAAGAVALIGTGRTAMAVLDLAAVAADDVVVITAAAGGLGCLFVQATRNAGATFVGLAGGPAKVDQVRSLGADVAVDYSTDGWPARVGEQLGERVPTLVLDGVGGPLGRGAFDLLGPAEGIVLFGYSSGEITSFTSADLAERGLTVLWSIGPAMMKRFGGLAPLETMALGEAAAGRLVPVVGRRFPLADSRRAPRRHRVARHDRQDRARDPLTVFLLPFSNPARWSASVSKDRTAGAGSEAEDVDPPRALEQELEEAVQVERRRVCCLPRSTGAPHHFPRPIHRR